MSLCIIFMKIIWVLDLNIIKMFPEQHGVVKMFSKIISNHNIGMFNLSP